MKEKIFKKEEIKNIIRLYSEGHSSNKLAKKFNVSPPTILKLLLKNNINIRTMKESIILGFKKGIKKPRKMTEAIKNKISEANLGEKNGMWKGDNVSYDALHQWIRNNKPKPQHCESCRTNEPYDLANISGEYKRDVNDFEWLCRRCHMIKDERMKNLKQYKNE